jgi:hypothetical protein
MPLPTLPHDPPAHTFGSTHAATSRSVQRSAQPVRAALHMNGAQDSAPPVAAAQAPLPSQRRSGVKLLLAGSHAASPQTVPAS